MALLPEQEIGEYIREDFQAAFDEWEQAHGKEKEAAAARLSRATRTLYDYVAYERVPPDFQFRHPTKRS
jgi:hypothetical protein